MTGRAVSDTVGFVFAFALVTASIGAVYVSGIDGLRDARTAEQLENMERAFDVLADNLRDVHARGAPSRATEIALSGGRIALLDPVRITIRTNGTNCATPCPRLNNTTVLNPQPIAYSLGETDVLYVAGAVLRADRGNAVMLSDPGWVTDADRALFPGIVTYAGGQRETIGGETTVLVVALRQSRGVGEQVLSGGGHDLTVNVSIRTPRVAAWKRFFEARGYTITRHEPSNDVVYAEFTTQRVYVTETVIEVALRG